MSSRGGKTEEKKKLAHGKGDLFCQIIRREIHRRLFLIGDSGVRRVSKNIEAVNLHSIKIEDEAIIHNGVSYSQKPQKKRKQL